MKSPQLKPFFENFVGQDAHETTLWSASQKIFGKIFFRNFHFQNQSKRESRSHLKSILGEQSEIKLQPNQVALQADCLKNLQLEITDLVSRITCTDIHKYIYIHININNETTKTINSEARVEKQSFLPQYRPVQPKRPSTFGPK